MGMPEPPTAAESWSTPGPLGKFGSLGSKPTTLRVMLVAPLTRVTWSGYCGETGFGLTF